MVLPTQRLRPHPPNSCGEILTPGGDGIRRRGLTEVIWSKAVGSAPLEKRPQTAFASFTTEDAVRIRSSVNRDEGLTRRRIRQCPRSVRSTFLFRSYPVHHILSQQPERTETDDWGGGGTTGHQTRGSGPQGDAGGLSPKERQRNGEKWAGSRGVSESK